MTRRERMIRIIDSWGPMSSFVSNHESWMLAKLGLRAYTDEAIEELARSLVESQKRQQKMNRENRARGAFAKVPA